DLDQRSATLSVGEFAAFAIGPRDAGGGAAAGVWRAQLGTHWHNELRARTLAESPAAEFEVPISGRLTHHGWTLSLTGRIDQLLRPSPDHCHTLYDKPPPTLLREIKTVTRPLPADEAELRAAYPEYFAQLAAYAALARSPLCHIMYDKSAGPAGAGDPPVSEIVGASGSSKLPASVRAELVFVETDSGLAQTIALSPADDSFVAVQLARVAEFLDLRLRARERLRHLRYRAAFTTPRPGQETTQAELTALFARHPLVFFEAPTGFGKTGVLLEFALGQLRSGHFDRALYLTSKSTGQLQVVRTLAQMTAPESNPLGYFPDQSSAALRLPAEPQSNLMGYFAGEPSDPKSEARNPKPAAAPVAAWHVRNKAEHCVNATFHCVRESCAYLDQLETRWPASGLARFYLDEHHARDLDTLRAAGRAARICPYEITRAALAFTDDWIGDYNYVFAPRNRGLFFDQPGFDPARTLLLLDEAHNLPARVADAYSHLLTAADAHAVRDELHRIHALATLVTAWDHWCHFLQHLPRRGALPAADEDDARHLLAELARLIATTPLDYATLAPPAAELLWHIPTVTDALAAQFPALNSQPSTLNYLFWSPHESELALTCLDAAPAIGATLREFGGAVFASATLSPTDAFAAACGLDTVSTSRLSAPSAQPPAAPVPEKLGTLTKRATKKLYAQLTSAADLLRVEEERDAASPALLRAETPWRDGAYDLAFDARVDTTFQHRAQSYAVTAATIAALHAAAHSPVAIFFPSYAYAETIAHELALPSDSQLSALNSQLQIALQPRLRDLAAQAAWVEESLLAAHALFLVLGSSFAESIDLLGGSISHAMIVGPALPEVNPVQHARLAALAPLGRPAAFRRVYQIPGMTKVNQALGRLVRAPGHRARVVLHCRRFLDPGYAALLDRDYRTGTTLRDDADFANWLNSRAPARADPENSPAA
ncbi:MAG TPA: helicase C-terminal domain-containing protein, partial [Opitutus sp.]|nr:helicase C-terminal domain-containing protein [Opitutus sp.]